MNLDAQIAVLIERLERLAARQKELIRLYQEEQS